MNSLPTMDVKLCSVGQRFVDGMSNAYDDTFPTELAGLVSPADFEKTISDLNSLLAAYWPCCWCYYLLGYGCCLCSAGLSLLAPRTCIKDVSAACMRLLRARCPAHSPCIGRPCLVQAEQFARETIVRINAKPWVQEAGLEWSLVKSCGSSAIHIRMPATALPMQNAAEQVSRRGTLCAACCAGQDTHTLTSALPPFHAANDGADGS